MILSQMKMLTVHGGDSKDIKDATSNKALGKTKKYLCRVAFMKNPIPQSYLGMP